PSSFAGMTASLACRLQRAAEAVVPRHRRLHSDLWPAMAFDMRPCSRGEIDRRPLSQHAAIAESLGDRKGEIMEALMPIVTQLIAGAIGGNAASVAMKQAAVSTVVRTIVG